MPQPERRTLAQEAIQQSFGDSRTETKADRREWQQPSQQVSQEEATHLVQAALSNAYDGTTR